MGRKLLGILVWIIYRLLSLTWRLQVIEPESMRQRLKNRETMVLAHWHGDELVLLYKIGHYRIATIASTSKDGEMMNTIIHLMGAKTSRGSSTRGAVGALKGILRLIKEGYNTSFAVDGPKGPIYVVKPGVFEVSRLTGAPIYWSGVSADRAWHFSKSWNKTFLPKPFARVKIQWHGPFAFSSDTYDPRDENLRLQLADALHNARVSAAKDFAETHS